MQDKSHFKFGLYLNNETLGNQVISERIFDADVYNHPTRYSVNIKQFSHEIISSFQRVLSTKNSGLTFKTYVGKNSKGKKVYVDHNKYVVAELDENKRNYNITKNDYNFNYPQELNEAFKFTLKIGDNIIIERDFTVLRFNPKAIFSNEVMDLVNEWVSTINDHIKQNDIRQMWQENALIERYGYQVNEVRTMDKDKKDSLLKKISQN
jgi:hypothetical protein